MIGETELSVDEINTLSPLLHAFFPDCQLDISSSQCQTTEGAEILTTPERILSHLQTIFFQEHLLEIQLDQSTRVFFANLLDDLPDLVESVEDDQVILTEPDYEVGSYLKNNDGFIITPLTPGLGNARIRSCNHVLVRYFSGTTAIELGCTFRGKDSVRDLPVLRLNFPVVGRINKNYRPYRVKALSAVDAKVVLLDAGGKKTTSSYQLVDLSAFGIGFEIAQETTEIKEEESINLLIKVPGVKEVTISGVVRHISKVRDNKGYRNICGVQFDLETRALASEIEQIVAAIQRMQLREMAEKTSGTSDVRIVSI